MLSCLVITPRKKHACFIPTRRPSTSAILASPKDRDVYLELAFQSYLSSLLPSFTILGFDDNCTIRGVQYARILAPNVTRSLFKINLYAARGPRNQTGSFYTDCQRNVTTQTHVSTRSKEF